LRVTTTVDPTIKPDPHFMSQSRMASYVSTLNSSLHHQRL
jgi:hypothetical protein